MPDSVLLVISASDDVHVQRVLPHMDPERVVVWDPAWDCGDELSIRFAGALPLDAEISTGTGVHRRTLSAANVHTVWYRRPFTIMPYRAFRSLSYFVMRERDDTLDGVLRIWENAGVRVFNRPEANRIASNKPYQYFAALDVGLRLPETLISNSPARAVEQVAKGRSVLKGVSLSGIDDDHVHRSIFVREIDERALSTVHEQLPACPATIQEVIDWSYAVRVLICGDFMRAFNLPRESSLDWRTQEETTATEMTLPASIVEKLSQLLLRLGIGYGAIDLLADRYDQLWFLEVNPNGQWLWLEDESDVPLSALMADYLTQPVRLHQ